MHLRRRRLFALTALAALGALTACQDAIAPEAPIRPQFAQGVDGVWTVNSLLDPGSDAVCDDTECTLREAIVAAAPSDSIIFAPGLVGTILLTSGLSIDKPLAIVGPGWLSLIVDASGTGSRALTVTNYLPDLLPVQISGLAFLGSFEAAAYGAGVFNSEALTLRDVAIANGRANFDGGGIYNEGGLLVLLNSMVFDNQAGDNGAGIYGDAASYITIIGSTLTGNLAEVGGAIYTEGHISILRSTISANAAVFGDGLSVVNESSQLTARSSTIVDQGHFTYGAAVTLANTVLGGGCITDEASVTSLGHNVLVDCDGFAPLPTDVVLTAAQLFTEVLEPALAPNGGATMTHGLLASGRAVDAGYCPSETEDQRGLTRPVDHPLRPNAADGCDIGAYELQVPPPPVVPVADLMVSQAVNKTSARQGEQLTYTIRVRNLGPDTAPNVVMNDVLSSGVTFVSAHHNTGTHTAPPRGETGTVTWYLGDMLDEADEVAEIVVTVLVKGKTTITNTATVASDGDDPNEANNAASITVSIPAGGGNSVKPRK